MLRRLTAEDPQKSLPRGIAFILLSKPTAKYARDRASAS